MLCLFSGGQADNDKKTSTICFTMHVEQAVIICTLLFPFTYIFFDYNFNIRTRVEEQMHLNVKMCP